MKKIFSTAPDGNDNAQFVGVEYIKNDEIAQPLLANIDLLLTITRKYSVDANLLIEKDKVKE